MIEMKSRMKESQMRQEKANKQKSNTDRRGKRYRNRSQMDNSMKLWKQNIKIK